MNAYDTAPAPSTPKRHSAANRLLSWTLTLLIPVVLAVGARTYLVDNYFVPTASMEPTMMVDSRFIATKPLVNPDGPEYGRIILFTDTQDWMDDGPVQQDMMVKRVIATEGDTIRAEGGTVYRNNIPLVEPYAVGVTAFFPEQTVPAEHVWVMGDNREQSADSRAHITAGTQFVPETDVVGYAWFQWNPSIDFYGK